MNNDIWQLLSNYRRRETIVILDEQKKMTLSEVCEHISVTEDYHHSEIRRMMLKSHLEKLIDANVIRYDEASETLRAVQKTSDVADFIRVGRLQFNDQ